MSSELSQFKYLRQAGTTVVELIAAVTLTTLSLVGFLSFYSGTIEKDGIEDLAKNIARIELEFAKGLHTYVSETSLDAISEVISYETLRDNGYLDDDFGEGVGNTPLGQALKGIIGVKDGIRMSYGVIATGEIDNSVLQAYGIGSEIEKEALF
jgi:hypothetical protein